MALATGSRLGPYEIAEQLGVGGMGEVFRARDLDLGRDVAIKVLPDAVADDAERLARLTREARVLASLRHPNIAIVYGLEKGPAAGPAGAGHYVHGLVMELVEGETLAEIITRRTGSSGPAGLPFDEALPIATQIADALAAAHEHGIVHRDLKPANIKIRADGTVKVLDFGLAKALDQGSGIGGRGLDSLSMSPTITTPAVTMAGVILGTAAYMSPEQAKGRPIDKRADVWAFGCVLYEMLSGRRAFSGDDVGDTLASILKTEPDWRALNPDVPVAASRLIERCLAKDAKQRVADLNVAKFVLTEARALAESQGSPHAVAESRDSQRRSAVVIGVTALAAAPLAALTMWALTTSAPAPTVSRFSFTVPQAHQLSSTRKVVAISPDGQRLAYAGLNGLYLRSASEWEARVIARTDSAVHNPVFSPDGQSIAFTAGLEVHRIAVGGGVAVRVCAVPDTLSLSWDPSGILVSARQGVFRCTEKAMPEQLATVADDEYAHGAQILPGGQTLIFTIATATPDISLLDPDVWDNARVVVQQLNSHERRTLVTGSDARYLPTGHLLYSVRGVVLAVPFDPARQQILGAAVPVIDGVRRALNATSGATQYDVSASGSLLYISGPAEGPGRQRVLVTGDRAGNLTPLDAPPGSYEQVRASPDGARLAMDSDDGKEANVWIYEREGKSAPQRLTFGGRNRFPIWSPDGQHVAFQSDRDGDRAIWMQRVDGSGLERLTTPEKGDEHIPESWSKNGNLSFQVVKVSSGPEVPSHSLSVLSLRERVAKPFGMVQSFGIIGSTFSPDGRWIAYHSSSRGGRLAASSGVFVQPFPATGLIRQAPRVGLDFQPMWSADGRELFYVPIAGAGGQVAAVPVVESSRMKFGEPRILPGAIVGGRTAGLMRGFDMLPDGRFVGLVSPSNLSAGTSTEVRVVLGWVDELKRLVPPKK